jgi:aspartate racemase
MPRIGVFGGMGPAATVDFLDKLVQLTPAKRDQEHLPIVVASFPHVHDRSRAILGVGADPLPQLLAGIDFLNDAMVGVIAIPCNSSHHWYGEMSARAKAPILHIAQTCVDAITDPSLKVAVFATRGALASGFYQKSLAARGIQWLVPPPDAGQSNVDDCIRYIKAGELAEGAAALDEALKWARSQRAGAVIMGCTEIPIAARAAKVQGLQLVDSSLELARATVNYALERGWNRPSWDS